MVFSDWCEYEPLDVFLADLVLPPLELHASSAGRGESAMPYLHVEDLLSFYIRVVERCDDLGPGEVLMASPDGCTTTSSCFARRRGPSSARRATPLFVPGRWPRLGIRVRERLGRVTGRMPFERSWMVDYIDLRLDVDASRTRRRIDWAPNPDRVILNAHPDVIENLVEPPRRVEDVERARERPEERPDRLPVGGRLSQPSQQTLDLGEELLAGEAELGDRAGRAGGGAAAAALAQHLVDPGDLALAVTRAISIAS